jgi:hypothetical protein
MFFNMRSHVVLLKGHKGAEIISLLALARPPTNPFPPATWPPPQRLHLHPLWHMKHSPRAPPSGHVSVSKYCFTTYRLFMTNASTTNRYINKYSVPGLCAAREEVVGQLLQLLYETLGGRVTHCSSGPVINILPPLSQFLDSDQTHRAIW